MNRQQCVSEIRARRNFKNSTGAFHGEWSTWLRSGYAPEAVLKEIHLAIHPDGETKPRKTYIVYSYGTPIAYAKEGGDLVVFDVKYSNTTSRHSSICRNA